MNQTHSPRTARVFLSYSSKDAELALRLAQDLRAANLAVWLDQWELKIGQQFEPGIEQGVADADFVIVLLTHASVASDWVRREWSLKVLEEEKRKRISVVPVRGERCEIPDFLAQRSHADISGGSYRMGLRRLLEILRHHADEAAILVPGSVDPDSELDMNTLPIPVPIGLEVGHDLIPIFEQREAGINRFMDELLVTLREELLAECGFAFPGVQVRGNETDMPPRGAIILLEEIPESMLAIGADDVVVDASEYLILELKAVLRRWAALFVDIDITRALVDGVAQSNPALVASVVPARVSWIELCDVLQRLVAENIGIGDMARILAALADISPDDHDPIALAERARHALRAQITARFASGRGELTVLRLAPDIEAQVRAAVQPTSSGRYLALEPRLTQQILAAIRHTLGEPGFAASGIPILTTSDIRHFIRKLVELEFPTLGVLSDRDLLEDIRIDAVRQICLDKPPDPDSIAVAERPA